MSSWGHRHSREQIQMAAVRGEALTSKKGGKAEEEKNKREKEGTASILWRTTVVLHNLFVLAVL